MTKALVAAALAASLALAGCNTTGSTPTPAQDPRIAEAQAIAAQVCGYLPTVSTIASIIAGFVPQASVASVPLQIAQGVCNAVTAKSLKRGGARPAFNGVPIRGRFVR